MYRVVALYNQPEDPDAFLHHYRTVHSQLAKTMPGLTSYTWGLCENPDGSPASHYLAAVQEWDSKDAALASLGSPEGQKAVADMPNFGAAGAAVCFFESNQEV